MDANSSSSNKGLFIGILVVVLVAGGIIGGFVGGMNYQKNKATKTADAASLSAKSGAEQFMQGGDEPGGGNRPKMMMGPGANNSLLGAVTSISETSITVKSERTDESKTYTITGDTQIEKDGTIAAYTDIATDATVMVVADSKNTGNALRITINPAMTGRMSSPGGVQIN